MGQVPPQRPEYACRLREPVRSTTSNPQRSIPEKEICGPLGRSSPSNDVHYYISSYFGALM